MEHVGLLLLTLHPRDLASDANVGMYLKRVSPRNHSRLHGSGVQSAVHELRCEVFLVLAARDEARSVRHGLGTSRTRPAHSSAAIRTLTAARVGSHTLAVHAFRATRDGLLLLLLLLLNQILIRQYFWCDTLSRWCATTSICGREGVAITLPEADSSSEYQQCGRRQQPEAHGQAPSMPCERRQITRA
jgi:hypothetical protein